MKLDNPRKVSNGVTHQLSCLDVDPNPLLVAGAVVVVGIKSSQGQITGLPGRRAEQVGRFASQSG